MLPPMASLDDRLPPLVEMTAGQSTGGCLSLSLSRMARAWSCLTEMWCWQMQRTPSSRWRRGRRLVQPRQQPPRLGSRPAHHRRRPRGHLWQVRQGVHSLIPANLAVAKPSPHLTELALVSVRQLMQIEKAQIMKDPHTRESRGFGFVTFENSEDAAAAMAALNATTLDDRTITVEKVSRLAIRHIVASSHCQRHIVDIHALLPSCKARRGRARTRECYF